MPDAEELWQAKSAQSWLDAYEKLCRSSNRYVPSLHDLFSRFIDGELVTHSVQLSPFQLRLLLHPLQSLVCHLRQFLSCFSDGGSYCKASQAVSKSATRARLEDIQRLLQQWYTLSTPCTQSDSENAGNPLCATSTANLIIYHLISLNTLICFPDIERLARREVALSSWLQMRGHEDVEETLFHCGQVLRLVRSMAERVRPPWWSAAVYRVALIAWATSMARHDGRDNLSSAVTDSDTQTPFAIDGLPADHESVMRYMKARKGTPMFSKADGALVALDVPETVLRHCIEILEADSTMRLTGGIHDKLVRLVERWSVESNH